MEKKENKKKQVWKLKKNGFAESQNWNTRQTALRAPHTRSSLGFENGKKNKTGLSSARDLELGKPVVCRVSELGHSANSFMGPTHA